MKDRTFTIRLDSELYNKLTELAGNDDRSRAGFIRNLIKQSAGDTDSGGSHDTGK